MSHVIIPFALPPQVVCNGMRDIYVDSLLSSRRRVKLGLATLANPSRGNVARSMKGGKAYLADLKRAGEMK